MKYGFIETQNVSSLQDGRINGIQSRMKMLKQSTKLLTFSFAVLIILGFLRGVVFAAEPTTESECKAVTPNAGECRDDDGSNSCAVGAKHQYGTCGTGKVCCIPSGSVGSKCESSERSGSCKEKGSCDSATEDDLGAGKDCQKVGMNNPDLTCCSLKSSSPNADVTCNKLQCGNGVTGTCSPECTGDLKPYGDCIKTGASAGTVKCCIPNSCTPTATTSSSPSGSTSLTYTPLENLPGFDGQSGDFATYFGNLYKLALWIVGISALFMLVVGGFLYLSSAGNTSLLGTAKKTIYSALIGLVVALISWLLLDTINGDLTNLHLSGLSGAVGGGSTTTPSTPLGPTPTSGSGSGCSGIPTQSGIDKQCGDASQALSDALKCMADKVGANKMQLSSISDSAGFDRCQNHFSDQACNHAQNSCHYGGSNKNSKSCAADISTKGSSAPKEDIKSAARGCGVPFVNDEGNHVHISVKGCTCDGHN